MSEKWRMTVRDLALGAGEVVSVPKGMPRFFYARHGRFSAEAPDRLREVAEDDGFFSGERLRLSGEGLVWVYEARPGASAPEPSLGSVVLSRVFDLDIPGPWLLRADRIESKSGAATPRHGHRGPGMRRLVYGRLLAELGEDVERIEEGQAWFETGRDPVVGTNIHSGNSAFVRLMLLPNELAGGKSSFLPASPDEAAKPRAVTNRLFGEVIMGRPTS